MILNLGRPTKLLLTGMVRWFGQWRFMMTTPIRVAVLARRVLLAHLALRQVLPVRLLARRLLVVALRRAARVLLAALPHPVPALRVHRVVSA